MSVFATARSYVQVLTRAPARNFVNWRRLRPWFRRPLRVVAHGLYRGPAEVRESRMRDGRSLAYRPGTADLFVIREMFADDAYRFGSWPKARLGFVVDVGAHIGTFSLRAAPSAERILAFEPMPDNFALLERNLAGHAFTHVERKNAAVSDAAGTLRIWLGGANTGGHSAFPLHVPAPGSFVDAPAVVLSHELDARGVTRVDFLKIDCEGGEYAIVDDLERWGLSRVDRIAMEYHRAPPGSPAGRSGEGLEARLVAAGFRVERLPGEREGFGMIFATRVG